MMAALVTGRNAAAVFGGGVTGNRLYTVFFPVFKRVYYQIERKEVYPMTEQEKKYVESLKSALEAAEKRADAARLEANTASARCFALEHRLSELLKPVDFPDASGNMPDVLDITPMECLTRAAELAEYLKQVIAKNQKREDFLTHELGNARLENRMLKRALQSAGVCLEDYAPTLSGVCRETESAPRPASARKPRKRKEA